MKNTKRILACSLLILLCFIPEMALASVDNVFISPLEKLLSFISKAAAVIGGLALAGFGISYIFNRDDLSGWVSGLAKVAIGCAIVLSASLITNFLVK